MTCPDCYSELVSSLKYQYEGEELESKYCIPCDCWVPEPKYSSTKWKPRPEDFIPSEAETPAERRKRQLSGRWRGLT